MMKRTIPFTEDEIKCFAHAEIRVYSGPFKSLVVGDIRESQEKDSYVKYHEEAVVPPHEESVAIEFFKKKIKSLIPDPDRTILVYEHGDLGKKVKT